SSMSLHMRISRSAWTSNSSPLGVSAVSRRPLPSRSNRRRSNNSSSCLIRCETSGWLVPSFFAASWKLFESTAILNVLTMSRSRELIFFAASADFSSAVTAFREEPLLFFMLMAHHVDGDDRRHLSKYPVIDNNSYHGGCAMMPAFSRLRGDPDDLAQFC